MSNFTHISFNFLLFFSFSSSLFSEMTTVKINDQVYQSIGVTLETDNALLVPGLQEESVHYLSQRYSDFQTAPLVLFGNLELRSVGSGEDVFILLNKINISEEGFDFEVRILNLQENTISFFNIIPGKNDRFETIIEPENFRFTKGCLVYTALVSNELTYSYDDDNSDKFPGLFVIKQVNKNKLPGLKPGEGLVFETLSPGYNLYDGYTGNFDIQSCIISENKYFLTFQKSITTPENFTKNILVYQPTLERQKVDPELINPISISLERELNYSIKDGDSLFYTYVGKRGYTNELLWDLYGWIYDKNDIIESFFSIGFYLTKFWDHYAIYNVKELKILKDRFSINGAFGYIAYETNKNGLYELNILNIKTGSKILITTSPGNFGEIKWTPDGSKLIYSLSNVVQTYTPK